MQGQPHRITKSYFMHMYIQIWTQFMEKLIFREINNREIFYVHTHALYILFTISYTWQHYSNDTISCISLCQYWSQCLIHDTTIGSFHVKWTNFWKHPHFTISDFEEILLVASNAFQTRFCKVSATDNQDN